MNILTELVACCSSLSCFRGWRVCLFGPGTSSTRCSVREDVTNVVECSEEEYPGAKSVVGVVGRPRTGLLWDEYWMFTLSSGLGRTGSNGDWPARLDPIGHMILVIMPVQ
jgi:hypothetical protein